MNRAAVLRAPVGGVATLRALGLAAALGMAASPGHAAQTSATVNVVVNLQTGIEVPTVERCTVIGAFAATVTISCAPGAVRFITAPPTPQGFQDSDGNYPGVGAVTSWRRIMLNDKEYFEMMVRW